MIITAKYLKYETLELEHVHMRVHVLYLSSSSLVLMGYFSLIFIPKLLIGLNYQSSLWVLGLMYLLKKYFNYTKISGFTAGDR